MYYSPWGRKELDTTELNCPNHSQGERRMSTSLHQGYVTELHLTPMVQGEGDAGDDVGPDEGAPRDTAVPDRMWGWKGWLCSLGASR